MRIRLVFWNLGRICLVLAMSLIFPLLWSVHDSDGQILSFGLTILITAAVGGILCLICHKEKNCSLRKREGYALVTFAWVMATILGALPFMFSGVCNNFADAVFETMSGFTTTGSSVLSNLETLPPSILLWRALTHWLGGMGIVVLLVALISGSGTMHLYNAEAPGNDLSERLTPRISNTSKILWLTYIVLTIIMVIVLKIEGMSLLDALSHAFASIATGGFSSRSASVAAFDSPLIEWTLIFFMFISGANFAYFYFLIIKRKNLFFRSEEFRVYTGVVLVATALICAILLITNYYEGSSLEFIIRESCFQVVSIITTTGF